MPKVLLNNTHMKYASYFYLVFVVVGILFFIQAFQQYQAGEVYWLDVLLGFAAFFYAGLRIRMAKRYSNNRK